MDGRAPYVIHSFGIANNANMFGFHRLPQHYAPILRVLEYFPAKYTKSASMQQLIIVEERNSL